MRRKKDFPQTPFLFISHKSDLSIKTLIPICRSAYLDVKVENEQK